MRPSRATILAAINFAWILLLPQQPAAQAANLRIFASDGVREVMKQLMPQCERAAGGPIDVQFNTSANLKKRIDAGEEFDMAIFVTGLIDAMVKEGKIAGASRANLGRVALGVAVRAGSPKPDISTDEALKQTLLRAKSITYAAEGAGKPYIEKIFERLGITNEVKSKLILEKETGQQQRNVVEGKAEILFQPVSEILPYRGLELLGPLPVDLRGYIDFTAGVATNSPNAAAAKKVIDLLSAPAAAPVFKAKGMEPR